jgi:hypothetical protein
MCPVRVRVNRRQRRIRTTTPAALCAPDSFLRPRSTGRLRSARYRQSLGSESRRRIAPSSIRWRRPDFPWASPHKRPIDPVRRRRRRRRVGHEAIGFRLAVRPHQSCGPSSYRPGRDMGRLLLLQERCVSIDPAGQVFQQFPILLDETPERHCTKSTSDFPHCLLRLGGGSAIRRVAPRGRSGRVLCVGCPRLRETVPSPFAAFSYSAISSNSFRGKLLLLLRQRASDSCERSALFLVFDEPFVKVESSRGQRKVNVVVEETTDEHCHQPVATLL